MPEDPIKLKLSLNTETMLVDGHVDWRQVEDALLLIAASYVQAFAALHRDKMFYGLALDCNADYGQVFFCANTPSALQQQASEYQSHSPDHYGQLSNEQVCDRLRWSLGDWEYTGFTTEGFSTAWGPLEELLCDQDLWQADDDNELPAFRNSFLQTACRSMIRLESHPALHSLSRTADFRIFVADHDESEQDSWNRLSQVREEFARPAGE